MELRCLDACGSEVAVGVGDAEVARPIISVIEVPLLTR